MVEINTRKYLAKWVKYRIQITLAIADRKGGGKLFRSNIKKLLDDLITYAPLAFDQSHFNQMVGFLPLCWI